ncbi:hypothetical protein EON66_09520 [archaeon]|nr:MAG: hypothetical protein EON66_09520 [archaeon]
MRSPHLRARCLPASSSPSHAACRRIWWLRTPACDAPLYARRRRRRAATSRHRLLFTAACRIGTLRAAATCTITHQTPMASTVKIAESAWEHVVERSAGEGARRHAAAPPSDDVTARWHSANRLYVHHRLDRVRIECIHTKRVVGACAHVFRMTRDGGEGGTARRASSLFLATAPCHPRRPRSRHGAFSSRL